MKSPRLRFSFASHLPGRLAVFASATLVVAWFPGCANPPGNDVGQNLLAEFKKGTQSVLTEVSAVRNAQDKLIATQDDLKEKTNRVIQITADNVGNATYANSVNPQQNEHTRQTARNLEVAAKALGVKPTEESMQKVIADLQLALGQKQEDLARLEREHQAAVRAAEQANAARLEAVAHVGAATQDVQTKTQQLQTTATQLTRAEEHARLEAARAADTRKAADEERNARARLHVAYAFMAVGGLLIVVSVVATVLHVPGVLSLGASAGGVLVMLGYVLTAVNQLLAQTWFRVTLGAGCVVALAVGGLLALRAVQTRQKAQMDTRIGEGAIAALQEAKNDDEKLGRSTFAAVKPYLEEWYVDDDGKPEDEVHREIDRRLMKLQLKNPDAAAKKVLATLNAGVALGVEPKPHVLGAAPAATGDTP